MTCWNEELKHNITNTAGLKNYLSLTEADEHGIEIIIENFPMSVPEYYLSLIDPDDPKDPIRKMCIPSPGEMDISGSFDTSGEKQNTKANGLQHKYGPTALILSTNQCAMYCRHCFRKRLVGQSEEEIARAFDSIFDYIVSHKEITNVLLTGGDALMNSNSMIRYYLERLSGVPHIQWIRFGSRTPVVFPMRISRDPELQEIFRHYGRRKPIYIVTHFNHPRELTEEARKAIDSLIEAGVIVSNQTVLLKGVNDRPEVLAKLMEKLVTFRIVPYYVFQCRPVTGVKGQFQVPFRDGIRIVEEAKSMLSGHAKRFRYVLSHETGKIEIIGSISGSDMLFKYHQAKHAEDYGRLFVKTLEEDQCWLGAI